MRACPQRLLENSWFSTSRWNSDPGTILVPVLVCALPEKYKNWFSVMLAVLVSSVDTSLCVSLRGLYFHRESLRWLFRPMSTGNWIGLGDDFINFLRATWYLAVTYLARGIREIGSTVD